MRKIFLLAKIMLKSGGGASGKKANNRKWLIPLLIGFGFMSFAVSIISLTFEIYDVLAAGNLEQMILPMAFGAASIVVFFFGIFYVISTMYHANDIETFMYMPLRPYQILGAKFITLVVYEYIMEAFILVPILIAYGIKSAGGILYIVYSALLFLIVPVIALSMAAIIVMVIMRFTSFGKNKQVFKFVGGIIAIVLALGLNLALQSSASLIDSEQLMAIAAGESSIVSTMSNIFPGIIFASNALAYSATLAGFFNLLLFILCSGGAAAVFLGAGQLFYLKGVAGVTETSAKRREISAGDLGRKTVKTPILRSYVMKESRLLLRSPVAFLNCVLVNFIWPVIIIIMIVSRGGSMFTIKGAVYGLDSGLVIAVLVGVGAFVSSANAITSTAISREGKSLYFTKYIPLGMEKQFAAKVITGMIFSLMGIAVIIIAGIIIGIDIASGLAALVLCIPVIAVSSMTGILIDVSRPKLNWTNEQQAIKQNMNVLLHMLTGLVFAALIVLPILFLHMAALLAAVYIAALFLILAAFFANRIKTRAVSKLYDMDV